MKKLIFSSLCAMLMLSLCQENTYAQKIERKDAYEFSKMKNPPTYPGGLQKFYEFVGKNLTYPSAAIREKIQGNVFLSFVIEPDGSITDIKAANKLGGGTEEEAIRVIKLARKWVPGKVDGKPVRTLYSLPIKFSMKV